jgi:nucleoside-diphosphate-sugar epimerase
MDEDALRPAPVALYGLTKFAAESILARIAETQGVSFTAARLGVVYGPWEYATGVRDTLSPMLQTLELAAAGIAAVLGQPWRGDYTLSRDIAAGLVAIADRTLLPRTVYNLATGRASTAEDWCRVLATRLPGFRWRRAADGEAWNVESHTGFDRGAMDIGKICADTTYRPRFDLPGAVDHLLAWRQAG